MNNKKAFVDQILLWFIIGFLVFGFIATVSDENDMRVKHHNLKSMTDHASMAAAKYYTRQYGLIPWADASDERADSEDAANLIVKQNVNSFVAKNVPITYVWRERDTTRIEHPEAHVEAQVTHYHDNFWWKLFGYAGKPFNVSSIAAIETIEGDNVVPIGVNGCTQDFLPGDVFSLDLTAHDVYDKDDNTHFYALSDKSLDPTFDCTLGDGDAQAAFTQFKQIIDNVVKDKLDDSTTFNIEEDYKPVANVCEHELYDSNALANDLKQTESSFGSDFPIRMSIVVLGCASTDGNNLEYKEIIPIEVTGIDFLKKDHFTLEFTILEKVLLVE